MEMVIEYPSSKKLIIVLAKCLSLNCEVDLIWLCALPLSVEVVLLREELCTPKLYLPKFSVEVPSVGSPVWMSY